MKEPDSGRLHEIFPIPETDGTTCRPIIDFVGNELVFYGGRDNFIHPNPGPENEYRIYAAE